MALDQGQGVLMVLLDLSAAFDTVDHDILTSRLESRVGITGTALNWTRSYLTDRTQSVRIGAAFSEPVRINIGVPQGSVLGPLFFLVYILPIADILRKHRMMYHGYADDTQLYVRFDPKNPASLLEAIARLEACLCELSQWMVENKLKLNPDKTEFIIFVMSHLQALVDQLQPTLRVSNSTIHPSKCVRNLGAYFDREMSMLPHVNQTVRGVYYKIKSISRIRHYLDNTTCARLVQALVTTKLDYCNSLLAGLPHCALHKLRVAQHSAARVVSGASRRQHITPVLKQLHWLPLDLRIQYKLGTLIYQSLYSESSPSYLTELLIQNNRRNTRSATSGKLIVPRSKKKVGDRAFATYGPRLWNTLPGVLRDADTLSAFKSSLKTHLFMQHFID